MAENTQLFASHISRLETRLQSEGLPLHEYQVLMALRLKEFSDAIGRKLADGYKLMSVVRVYYSQAVSLLEVLARFSKGTGLLDEKTAILLTFKSTTYDFISIAEDFDEPLELKPEGMTLLPFTMVAPSDNEQIGCSTNANLVAHLQMQRTNYLNALVGDDGRVKGLASALTSCQSCNPSSTTTDFQSEYTTGPGGHTTTDYRTDTKTDDDMDCVTDTNDDPDSFALSPLLVERKLGV